MHRRADLVERRLLFSLPEATNRFVLRPSISAPSICVKLCELHLRVFLGIVSGRGSNCIWFCDDEPASRSIDAVLVNNTAAAAKYDAREQKAPDSRPGPSLYRLSSGSLSNAEHVEAVVDPGGQLLGLQVGARPDRDQRPW